MLNIKNNFHWHKALKTFSLLGLWIFFVLFFFFFWELSAIAGNYYELTGDNIDYDYQARVLTVRGEARFIRDEFEIKADRLEFYVDSGDIIARGEPVNLITPEDEIKGETLTYNFYKREGELAGARSRINEINIKGESIKVVSDRKHTIETEKAVLTPCNLADPHYRIQAERILFYPEDRIVAEQVSFWWGDTSLITLPSYVISLVEDEETGEFSPSVPPSVIYQLGYDWQEGLFFEFEYPYEIDGLTTGAFYYRDTMGEEREISAENELIFDDSMVLDTYYQQEEFIEDDEFVRTEKYGTELTYFHSDHYSAKMGYKYIDDTGEIEDNYYLSWNYNITSDLELKQQLSRVHKWKQGAKESGERKHPLTTTINYNPENRQQRLDFHYDFYAEQWRREYFWQEALPEEAELSFYRDYQGETLVRQKYSLSQQVESHEYSIKFRRGYEREFLPYTKYNLDLPGDFVLKGGFGRLAEITEDRQEVGQIAVNPSWSNTWQVVPGLNLSAGLSFHHINYSPPAEPDFFQALKTELGFTYNFNLNPAVDMEVSLLRQENLTDGEAYLERDEVERSLNYDLESRLNFATEAPESGVQLGLESSYNMLGEKWDEFTVRLKRYLDCYSYYGKYDFQRGSFRAGLSFDL